MKLETLFTRFNGRCVYCADEVLLHGSHKHPRSATRDHFIPLSKGGSRGAKNTVLACRRCNNAKGDMDPRLILYAWLWLNPVSFNIAVQRIDQFAAPLRTIH